MIIYGKYERLFWEKKRCFGTFLQIDQAKSPKFYFEMINVDVAIAIKYLDQQMNFLVCVVCKFYIIFTQ